MDRRRKEAFKGKDCKGPQDPLKEIMMKKVLPANGKRHRDGKSRAKIWLA